MTWIIYAGAGLVLLVIAAAVFRNIRKKGRNTEPPPYTEALLSFIEGDRDSALALLTTAVRKNTENIMAYVLLGNIIREKGNPQKAIKIHRNLLVRTNLTRTETREVLIALIRDFREAGHFARAAEMAEKLVKQDRKNPQYQELLLALYEENQSWDKAYFQRQALNRWKKQKDSYVLALYKVEAGLAAVKQGAEKEGRIRFREAIKLNKKCVPAYINWGDSLRRENRQAEALSVYTNLTKKNPPFAFAVFDRVKDVLFELGRYGEIELLYKDVIARDPDNFEAHLHMAELHMKQGNIERAEKECRDLYNRHPRSKRCGLLLISILRLKQEEREALRIAAQLLKNHIQSDMYTCSRCGHTSEEMCWHCPSCGAWDSFSWSDNT